MVYHGKFLFIFILFYVIYNLLSHEINTTCSSMIGWYLSDIYIVNLTSLHKEQQHEIDPSKQNCWKMLRTVASHFNYSQLFLMRYFQRCISYLCISVQNTSYYLPPGLFFLAVFPPFLDGRYFQEEAFSRGQMTEPARYQTSGTLNYNFAMLYSCSIKFIPSIIYYT